MYCIVLYYIILYFILLYYIILYYIILYVYNIYNICNTYNIYNIYNYIYIWYVYCISYIHVCRVRLRRSQLQSSSTQRLFGIPCTPLKCHEDIMKMQIFKFNHISQILWFDLEVCQVRPEWVNRTISPQYARCQGAWLESTSSRHPLAGLNVLVQWSSNQTHTHIHTHLCVYIHNIQIYL